MKLRRWAVLALITYAMLCFSATAHAAKIRVTWAPIMVQWSVCPPVIVKVPIVYW